MVFYSKIERFLIYFFGRKQVGEDFFFDILDRKE